jgi:hypothetical protein
LLIFAWQRRLTRCAAEQSFGDDQMSSDEKPSTESGFKHSLGGMDDSLDLAAHCGLCIVVDFCLAEAIDAPCSGAKLWQ